MTRITFEYLFKFPCSRNEVFSEVCSEFGTSLKMIDRVIPLVGGLAMPVIGFETWSVPADETRAAVYDALNAGFRRVDCSLVSHNIRSVGEAVTQAIGEGVVQRSDLFLTCEMVDPEPASVEAHLHDILDQLHIQHLDLLTVHWVNMVGPSNFETWRVMESLLAKGLVRAIGVVDLTVSTLEHMITDSVSTLPMVIVGAMNPLHRQNELLEHFRSKSIHWIATEVFGAGTNLLENERVLRMAVESNRSPAQLLISWALQRGTSVTLSTTDRDAIREYVDVFDWELSEEHFQLVNTLTPGDFLVAADPDRPVINKG